MEHGLRKEVEHGLRQDMEVGPIQLLGEGFSGYRLRYRLVIHFGARDEIYQMESFTAKCGRVAYAVIGPLARG